MAPLLIGLYIFTAAAAVGPASGGSFNPARSITPAFVNGEFGDLWIYILGPLAGGVIGAVVWVALAEQSAMRRTR
jgi:aquaporin Z